MAALAARIRELADRSRRHDRRRCSSSAAASPASPPPPAWSTTRTSIDVELWEASDRLGGKIATSPFGGLDHVDEGADAYLTARAARRRVRPQGRAGGADDLTSPTDATAMVWYDGLHPIPGGIVLGVPASVRPFVTTSLLSWRGKLRAAAEPFLPRTDPDDSLGALIRARFGIEVHDRLVDALVGSIYATDTDRASLAAVPQLAELAEHNRSLLLGGAAARRRAAARSRRGGPIFDAPVAGMGALVDAAERYVVGRAAGAFAPAVPCDTLEARRRRLGRRRRALRRRRAGDTGRVTAAELLDAVAPDAARRLASFEHADVIIGAHAVPRRRHPDRRRRRAQRLPRAEVAAAVRDRRVVRIAEVGALATTPTARRSCVSRSAATGCRSPTSTTTP